MTTVEENDTLKRKIMESTEGAAPEKRQKEAEDLDAKPKPNPKAREIRLEQNRKAARESRRRKKVMIEELQRSVIFFSRANSSLKQQNDEMTRHLMQAQMQVAAIESHMENSTSTPAGAPTSPDAKKPEAQAPSNGNGVAAQATHESKESSASDDRASTQATSGGVTAVTATVKETAPPAANAMHPPLPSMQPGATMQAMANFQQAASAAMQSAMGQMQNVPGVSVHQFAAAPAGTNAQQVYTDTMTAIVMQQAAAAAAASMMHPGMFLQPLLPWQLYQPNTSDKNGNQEASKLEGSANLA